MRPSGRLTLTAATLATLWSGGAVAATEQIVCRQSAGRPSMADCVLITPASQSSATGAGTSSPNVVTYDVAEPVKRDSRDARVAPDRAMVAEPAPDLRQPTVPQPYPAEWSPRDGIPEVRYIVSQRAVPAAASSETRVVPAQRIFVTEPAPFPSVTAPPWPD